MAQSRTENPNKTPVVKDPYEHCFDMCSFDQELASKFANPPTNFYDTVAQAHDSCYALKAQMADDPNPKNPMERRRLFRLVRINRAEVKAKAVEKSPDYLGIGWEKPGCQSLLQSTLEDNVGAIVVDSEDHKFNGLVSSAGPADVHVQGVPRKAVHRVKPPHVDLMTAVLERYPFEHPSDADDEFELSSVSGSTSRESFSLPPASPSPPSSPLPTPRTSPAREASQTSTPADSTDTEFGSDTDTDSDAESDCSCCNDLDREGGSCPRFLANVPRFLLPLPRRTPSIESAADLEQYGNTVAERRGGTLSFGPSPLSQVVTASSAENISEEVATPKRMVGKRRPGRATAPKRAPKKAKKGPSAKADHAPIVRETTPPSSSLPSTPYRSSLSPAYEGSSPAGDASQSPEPSDDFVMYGPATAKQTSFPCLLDGCTQVCSSAGDLMRHQQSLRHKAPEHPCLACGHAFTRPDALKRHLNAKTACKKGHQAALAKGGDISD